MTKHLLSYLKHPIAYFALFAVLAGTAYASVNTPRQAATKHAVKSATTFKVLKAGITCAKACPASSVYWAYIGATGGPGAQAPTTPNVYQTAVGAVPANLVHQGLGDWLVKFKSQDLSNCARIAELTHDRGSATASGYDHTNPDPTAIHVLTTSAAGQAADLDFVVLAFCGNSTGIQSTPAPPAAGVK
jgi:hypothetical protein